MVTQKKESEEISFIKYYQSITSDRNLLYGNEPQTLRNAINDYMTLKIQESGIASMPILNNTPEALQYGAEINEEQYKDLEIIYKKVLVEWHEMREQGHMVEAQEFSFKTHLFREAIESYHVKKYHAFMEKKFGKLWTDRVKDPKNLDLKETIESFYREVIQVRISDQQKQIEYKNKLDKSFDRFCEHLKTRIDKIRTDAKKEYADIQKDRSTAKNDIYRIVVREENSVREFMHDVALSKNLPEKEVLTQLNAAAKKYIDEHYLLKDSKSTIHVDYKKLEEKEFAKDNILIQRGR